MKRFLISVIFFLIIFLIPKSVLAVSEFKSSYNVSYDVGSDGLTQVTEKITLTNLTETYYASNFVLTIGSTSLTDIAGTDDGGAMEVKSEVKDNQTIVTLKFNNQITGINKKQTFTLRYKSNDFASMVGKSWEVNLPRIHEGVDIETFNLNLSVPFSFGEPTSVTPKPKSESDGAGKLTLNFTKEQLADSGVSVNFGSSQVFDYDLKYIINNDSFFPSMSSISLPMDTNYQDVLINSITPVPLNVTIDSDGNYLAWYQVQKRSRQEIKVTGAVKLYLNSKGNVPKLSKTQISGLTKSDKYWEKDSPSIKAVIAEIFKNGQPKTTKEKVHQIYQYTVNTLKFNSGKSDQTRLGALTSLSNLDKAKAEEFSDLFITLTRAIGIPARELDGTAYSQNKMLRPLSFIPNVTHVWPEYFDDQVGWVMVDPTWEQTSGGVDYFNKLDLNHFVLNIRGNSSTTPISVKSAQMNVSANGFEQKIEPDVQIDINSELWAGLPGTMKIKIQNNGSTIIPSSSLSVNSNNINLLDSKNIQVSQIPPYGFASFEVNFRTPFLKQYTADKVLVNYMNQQYSKQVNINPFFLFRLFPYLLGFAIFLVVTIYAVVLGFHTHKKIKKSK